MDSYPQEFPFGIMDVVDLLHLRVRRRQANSAYVDCPFCNDRRGKMNVNFAKNVWRCNYCDAHGGMLALYADINHITRADAYRELCDLLQVESAVLKPQENVAAAFISKNGAGETASPPLPLPEGKDKQENFLYQGVMQAEPASVQEVHQTLALLFEMLTLRPAHKAHLRSEKRGLTDEQIHAFGFKSTPPDFLCRSLTERLMRQGCRVQGVPGFYLHKQGYWTVHFTTMTAGILIPAIGADGLIRGAQILLDQPIKAKGDPPDKPGTKYLWLSSSNKPMGITSGSPVHFVGNPFARTIYVTEGLLKADIAHTLMNRSFAAIAGANNVQQLDALFALLSQNGTEQIIEAHDMDKYSNPMTEKGSSKIYLLAKKHGMNCQRLTWNPNYKGIDDWQLALRKKADISSVPRGAAFKERYLWGKCIASILADEAAKLAGKYLPVNAETERLGLSQKEYQIYCQGGLKALEPLLNAQRKKRHLRLYQLEFTEDCRTIPFAFKGMSALQKAGYEQPPAALYRLVLDQDFFCPIEATDESCLQNLYEQYREGLPKEYDGRPLSPSDMIELSDGTLRSYYYAEPPQFIKVRFSPFLAKPMKGDNIAQRKGMV